MNAGRFSVFIKKLVELYNKYMPNVSPVKTSLQFGRFNESEATL